MNRSNYHRDRGDRFRRPSSSERRPPHESQRHRSVDSSITGCESHYLSSLMERSLELVVVLRQGDQIAGRLAWYDQMCLKIAPSDGSPSLLIPKANIKYLYEAA